VLVLPTMQAGVDTFMNRIKGLEGDKSHLEEQLKRTQQSVTCLQVRSITLDVA
jgi:predicted nuclease with TOPRIM domain